MGSKGEEANPRVPTTSSDLTRRAGSRARAGPPAPSFPSPGSPSLPTAPGSPSHHHAPSASPSPGVTPALPEPARQVSAEERRRCFPRALPSTTENRDSVGDAARARQDQGHTGHISPATSRSTTTFSPVYAPALATPRLDPQWLQPLSSPCPAPMAGGASLLLLLMAGRSWGPWPLLCQREKQISHGAFMRALGQPPAPAGHSASSTAS